ncbi:hypothetical protein [Dysgonomonas sp. 511]|uniref:hypothetical protein n=1 Tax=Dysgonomonas sp. 511 TaxID=2302930 RepID=UPI0013D0A98C|nr:hypothetical protein [Dysgonomonas sp. 511]NDV78810.1 hypothetical protein [Dysgonomonas sp. 511]
MDSNILLEKYKALNSSFKEKLVFHLGYEAGFFSEYNNMILAMLYCLEHKIQFTLYSADAGFGFEKGWTDYFLPFCEEKEEIKMPFFDNSARLFHQKYNKRNHIDFPLFFTEKEKFKIWWYKKWNNVDFLTQDLWLKFHDRNMENKHYSFPQLGIEGDILDICRHLIAITWKYNSTTEKETVQIKKTIEIPAEYTGFHIRKGDKDKESNVYSTADYINKARSLKANLDNIFVLTDDYSVIKELKTIAPGSNIYTFCGEEETGYVHSAFFGQGKKHIKDSHLRLFASIDILSQSQLFIGTFSSNPGMYLGMRMKEGTNFGLDFENWLIW